MLKPAHELDTDKRITCLLAGWIALDCESGYHLRRSDGRRAAGRPAKYYLSNGAASAIMFTARNDQEALAKANQRLPQTTQENTTP
jgi:hypothetical protein